MRRGKENAPARRRFPVSVVALCLLVGLSGGRSHLCAQSSRTYAAAEEMQVNFRLTGVCRPQWNWGALFGVDDNDSAEPLIYKIGKDGTRGETRFRIPDATLITIYGVSGGLDGALALIGAASSADSRGALFLAWISPDRTRQTVIRPSPYEPQAVVIASDGSIWTAGWVVAGEWQLPPPHNVIRRFDTSGKEISSFVPWSGLKQGKLLHQAKSSRMVASRDRVGWYTNAQEYIELLLDGTVLGRYDAGPTTDVEMSALALSENNDLYVDVWEVKARKWEVLALDRDKRAWTPVRLAAGSFSEDMLVMGFDGEDLVTAAESGILHRHARAVKPAGTNSPGG